MKNKEFLNQELLPLTCKMFNKQLGLVEVSDAKIKSIKKYNWSYIIILNIYFQNKKENVYVKIQKNPRNKNCVSIDIKDKENIERGISEYTALKKLNNLFADAGNIDVVKPLGYIKPFNAIILSEIKGNRLFELIRHKKLSNEKTCDILKRIGWMLSLWHQESGINKKLFSAKDIFSPYRGISYFFDEKIEDMTHLIKEEIIPFSNMLLGFEIRNIFYSVENDLITLHDIVELEDKPVYEDISQFVVSIDLINWGDIVPKPLLRKYYTSFQYQETSSITKKMDE